jgi:hypothetical protein
VAPNPDAPRNLTNPNPANDGKNMAMVIDPKYVTPGQSNIARATYGGTDATTPGKANPITIPQDHIDALVKQYPNLGVAGHADNKAFVDAYSKAYDPTKPMSLEDTMKLADGLFAPKQMVQNGGQLQSTNMAPGGDPLLNGAKPTPATFGGFSVGNPGPVTPDNTPAPTPGAMNLGTNPLGGLGRAANGVAATFGGDSLTSAFGLPSMADSGAKPAATPPAPGAPTNFGGFSATPPAGATSAPTANFGGFSGSATPSAPSNIAINGTGPLNQPGAKMEQPEEVKPLQPFGGF